jgi:Protein of unknown function (DUF3039)
MAEQLLSKALDGLVAPMTIPHPLGTSSMGQLEVTYTSYDDREDLVVEFFLADNYRAGDLDWSATTRFLSAHWPPEQDWDRAQDSFPSSSILIRAPNILQNLQSQNRQRHLISGQRGESSHYTPEEHLTDRTIQGSSVRSLCGVFFVPMQDHEKLPKCPSCSSIHDRIDRELAVRP